MNFPINWRDRRNYLTPPQYPFANYCTDTKRNMKHTFADDLVFNNFYLGPDPLRKNLADTIITEEKMASNNKNKLEKEIMEENNSEPDVNMQMQEDSSRLAGITSFFSGVLSVISNVMFSKPKPDNFSCNSSPEMAVPSMWHGANISDENKILQDESSDDMPSKIFASDMSDCRSAAAHCQSKLEHVRLLLGSSKPVPCSVRNRRRPKKVFVEPNSVEDCFEDAFSPEDFENLANDSYMEYLSPVCYHEEVFHELESPKVKLEAAAVPKLISESPNLTTSNLTVNLSNINATVVDNFNVKDEPFTLLEESNVSSENAKKVTPKLDEQPQVFADNSLICESTEIVKNVPELITSNSLETDMKKELVESCEDKITKLKLLLQERRKKPTHIIEPVVNVESVYEPLPPIRLEPEPRRLVTLPPRPKPSYKIKDKRYKNSSRCSDKRKKSRIKHKIDDEMLFANEINSEELSSVDNSPSTNNMESYMRLDNTIQNIQTQQKHIPCKDYFDEVSGRFHPSSVDSEDSFQIVFNDSPRYRRQSDCESEDSFIVFEESPDSCYTSHDVFGGSSDSEDCDSDSDMSDSGCGVFRLSASLSKSVSNLADDSLYADHSEDEVDCANVHDFGMCDNVPDNSFADEASGQLLTERKKLMRKDLPTKRVHFSTEPPKIHVMRVWLFAAKQTRQRYWEQFVVDRERFKRRINDVDVAVSWVLKPQHRSRVMFQRFMPWWNAQKRQEIAEKKEREAQEKERLRIEEMKNDDAELDKEVAQTEEDTSNRLLEEDTSRMDVIKGENFETNKTLVHTECTNILKEEMDRPDCNKVKIKSNLEDIIEGKESVGNDTLVNKDVICQNSKENEKNTENNSMSIENIEKTKKFKNNKFNQIVSYNEKILDLDTAYSKGILNT